MLNRHDILIRDRTKPVAGWRRALWITVVSLAAALAVVTVAQAQPGPSAGVANKQAVFDQLFDRAIKGDAESQFRLAKIYARGTGVVGGPNPPEALKWLRRAAEQGIAEAQFELGMLYDTGTDVPRDYVKAHVWLEAAETSMARVGWGDRGLRRYRDELATKMTDKELELARQLSLNEAASGPAMN